MTPIARTLLAGGALSLMASLTAHGPEAHAATSSGNPTISSGWSRVLGFSPHLVGRDLNGTDLNGDSLDGRRVLGVRLDAGLIDGRAVDWLEVDGSQFTGRAEGRPVHTKDLADAILVADLDDGTTLPVYVTDVYRHPDKGLKDVYGYRVWFETQEGFEPLCGFDDEGEAALAIALEGRWDFGEGTLTGGSHIDDTQAFTFACDGYVLSKCVLSGYKPWGRMKTCTPGQGCVIGDLADHHQACTRALRADYHGDGSSHTADGTLINLYDDLGLRDDTEAWPLEAEWDADGARCVATPRDPAEADFVAPLASPHCGADPFAAGALLVTEVAPGG